MRTFRYLIIGGGMAAASAVNGIREVDTTGSIGMISAEPDPPYDRPPLSKALWKGKPLSEVWRSLTTEGLDVILGRSVQRLDLARKRALDDSGEEYRFDKLLLATGGTPRTLPFGGDDVLYFRTLRDYLRLREMADRGDSFAVIGGGFIGSEVAAALAMNGKHVTMIFPERSIGSRVYPSGLSSFIGDYYREHGVHLMPGRTVTTIESRGARRVVRADDGTEIEVDGIVAGLGIVPNVELARQARLPVGNGITVDESLRAGHPDVFAAGDVAEFYNPALQRTLRLEHEDAANTMGASAGRAMAGEIEPYRHLPFFYSDLFDLGYEAVGQLDTRLETVEDWREPNREGVIYYLKEGRVQGVLLWNVWEQVDAARQVIAEREALPAGALLGRIPAGQKAEAA